MIDLCGEISKTMKEPGKKNTDTGLEGIVDRHPELAIPLKHVKYLDRIRYKKRPKRKFALRSY